MYLATTDTPESSDSGLAVPQESSRQELPPPTEEPQSQVLSSLRLENQLLRSEVASLNQEMASVIQRAKDLQDGKWKDESEAMMAYIPAHLPLYWLTLFSTLAELNQARLRADRWNSEQSQTDRTLRELRSQVDDLTEALSAKDGQLAVLKIRLDEADQLLKSRSAALEEAQKEKSRYNLVTIFWSRDQILLFKKLDIILCSLFFLLFRIMQDHTEGSSMQSQALETIQERVREADLALRREQDSYRQMQVQYDAICSTT